MSEQEKIMKRHRKEKKELQAKIQSIKKSFDKGDKKKKKEALEEIEKLEKNLCTKHFKELNFLSNTSDVSGIDVLVEEMKINDSTTKEENCISKSSVQHISKAQKRRDRKEQTEKQRLAEIEAQEKENELSNRNLEMSKIVEILKTKNLALYDIPSNGDCLFAAICHQEKSTYVKKLRQDCVDKMISNKKEYLPFLTNPSTGEMFSDSEFENYCNIMATTNAWGGQVELHAISDILGRRIEVLQSEGPPIIIGGNESKEPPIILTYHKFYLALGEHYNSTIFCSFD